jgi:cytochrome c oxidase subunit 2
MNRYILAVIFLGMIGGLLYYGYADLFGAGFLPGQSGAVGRSGEVKEFTIRAFQYGFDPAVIEVEQDDTVIINIVDVDVPHGITIAEYGIATRSTEIGKPTTVRFIANKVGTFTYACSVYCGTGHESMVSGEGAGKLIVKPAGSSSMTHVMPDGTVMSNDQIAA